MPEKVEVYGTDSCKDTRASREHLDALKVPYSYIDIAHDPQAAGQVEGWNSGKRRTPTIVLHSEAEDCQGPRILSVPSNGELDAELDKARLLPKSPDGDGSPGVSGRKPIV